MPDLSSPYWAAVKTQSQREVYAGENLERAGFTIFLPRVETRRTIEPLFRGYCFVVIIDR
jgi:hypothetical protein